MLHFVKAVINCGKISFISPSLLKKNQVQAAKQGLHRKKSIRTFPLLVMHLYYILAVLSLTGYYFIWTGARFQEQGLSCVNSCHQQES